MYLQQQLWFSVNLVLAISGVIQEKEQDQSLLAELADVYEGLEANQIRLKHIIDEISVARTKGCLCVPYYLCDDGQVNTKGNKLIELRANTNPCQNQLEICCELSKNTAAGNAQQDREQCGRGEQIATKSDNVNEISSNFGEFPWTTMILKNRTRYQCAGSLIHPRVVLTAAHCVNNEDNYTVRAGEWDASTTDELYPHQRQQVQAIAMHPNYNDLDHEYDAALLLLEQPFILDKHIKTICLTDDSHIDLSHCYGSGWGLDPILESYQRVMKKVNYTLIPNILCEMKLRGTRLGRLFELHSSFSCAEGRGGRELCTGDGGAPLVCSSMSDHTRFYQVGIAVWGLGCRGESPSVFASVSAVHDWIASQLGAWMLDANPPMNRFGRFMD